MIAPLIGNPGESITNTAIANGINDDDVAVMASGSETVDINNVALAACLSKPVTELPVTHHVQVCNNSGAKSNSVDTLNDDICGNIADQANTMRESTNCVLPKPPAHPDEAGSCYTGSFKALTTVSPTTDIVTGSVSDDEGPVPATPSDSATVSFQRQRSGG